MARRENISGEPRHPYSLRLGDDERRVLEAAASSRGLPLGTYVRRAALGRARSELVSETPEPEEANR